MGGPGTICSMAPVCGKNVVVEHDGSVYACDHYVYPEYRIGNITEQSLASMVFSTQTVKFGLKKHEALPQYCRECKFLFACNGECPKNRFIRTPAGETGLNFLCSGVKKYFNHIDPYMKEMAKQFSRPRR